MKIDQLHQYVSRLAQEHLHRDDATNTGAGMAYRHVVALLAPALGTDGRVWNEAMKRWEDAV